MKQKRIFEESSENIVADLALEDAEKLFTPEFR